MISYEVQCRLCQAAPFQLAGWDQPVAGAPGSAMAAGRLLGLDKEQLRDALALAVVPNLASNQTRNGQLSMWKGVAGPNAARQGVFAAQLAAAGMTGPQDPFDGPVGLWKQTVGKRYSVQIPKRLKGHKFIIEQTNIKTFPVRDAIQVPIMAALKLREKVNVADIQTLRIDTYAKHFAAPMKDKALWTPKTRESADHSLPFCVAAAMIDGAVTPATFESGRYLDKDILALIKRLKITLNDEFEKVAPATRTCRLIATTKNDKEIAVQHRQTLRDIERGPSKQTFEDKFHLLASASLPEDARSEMADLIWSIDKAKTIDRLVDLTAI